MEADGYVYYVTPQQRVRGDAAVYDVASETIIITGDVVAVQGQNVLRGKRLVINAKTGDAQMQSANAHGPQRAGRARGVFYPEQTAGRSDRPRDHESRCCARHDPDRPRRPWPARAWWSTTSASRSAAVRW